MLIGSIFLAGCGSTASLKEREQIARSVYGTHDSMIVNRFDLAKQYSEESIRLIAPPKDRILIKGISASRKEYVSREKSNSKYDDTPENTPNYVILPEGINQDDVVIVGSDKWKTMLSQNNDLQKQVQAEQEKFAKLKKDNDETLRNRDEELAQYRGKQSLFTKINDFFHGGLKAILVEGCIVIGVILIGFIILCLGFREIRKHI